MIKTRMEVVLIILESGHHRLKAKQRSEQGWVRIPWAHAGPPYVGARAGLRRHRHTARLLPRLLLGLWGMRVSCAPGRPASAPFAHGLNSCEAKRSLYRGLAPAIRRAHVEQPVVRCRCQPIAHCPLHIAHCLCAPRRISSPPAGGLCALFFWPTATCTSCDGRLAPALTIACCHFRLVALAACALNGEKLRMPCC